MSGHARALALLRRVCLDCGAAHYATRCHVCKRPTRPDDAERAELLEIYRTLPASEHRRSFEAVIADETLLLCLRNVSEARRRAKAEQLVTDPGAFELVP